MSRAQDQQDEGDEELDSLSELKIGVRNHRALPVWLSDKEKGGEVKSHRGQYGEGGAASRSTAFKHSDHDALEEFRSNRQGVSKQTIRFSDDVNAKHSGKSSSTQYNPASVYRSKRSAKTTQKDVNRSARRTQNWTSDSEAKMRQRDMVQDSWDSLTFFANRHAGRIAPSALRSTNAKTRRKGDSNFTSDLNLKSRLDLTNRLGSAPVEGRTEEDGENLLSPSRQTASSHGFKEKLCFRADPSPFHIPLLPSGRHLKFDILSTWGDVHYVGLSGIEIFDKAGNPVKIDPSSISADPPDINIMPGYGDDPRTVDKLIDGVNRTCDDMHVWLAPFTAGRHHYIFIDLSCSFVVSMIRVWNYNKSRIHSYRGARYVEIHLDENPIFKGEIQKAPGCLRGSEENAENILFTMDESVLCAIEQHDANDINMNPQTTEVHVEESNLKDLERPKTASGRKNEAKQEQGHGMKEQVLPSETESVEISGPTKRLPPQVVVTESGDIEEEEMIVTPPIPSRIAQDGSDPFMRMDRRPLGLDGRPMTGMVEMGKLQGNSSSFPSSFSSDLLPSSPTTISGRNLTLVLHSNWGDSETLGLCGLDIILQDDSKLRVNASMILVTCEGADGGHEAACLDSTYAASLFMGPHELKGEEEMWVVPHYPYVKYRINIDMGEPRLLKHFCVWNYNGSIENTYRGVKRMSIVLDNRSLSPPAGHLVRKAPGPTRISIDFSQKICLTSLGERIGTPQIFRGSSSIITPEGYVMQEYEPPTLPSGFIFKFSLISTWDDRFYIGLNGIQLYDQFDNLVPVHPRNLKVVCTEGVTSIAELPDCVGDPRTAEKIIDGVNDTNDESHMWLAPFRRGETNNIFFMFDEPITLSLIKIWNYRKTVGRGVKEFLLSIDDTLVYKGHLRRATAAGEDSWQSILFTHDRHIVSRERGHVYVHFQEEPDELLFFDDAEEQEKVEEQESRPRTSFLPSK